MDKAADAKEAARIEALLTMLPPGRSVLDVGARDGVLTRRLVDLYQRVAAIDLNQPSIPGAECYRGDACKLPFADGEFDVITCTEVLEHVPSIADACRELMRVAGRYIVVGVPFRQDLRVGRTTCRACGAFNTPYGHLHKLDEGDLRRLFADRVIRLELVGPPRPRTNAISAWLTDRAGNPWGAYGSQEPCLSCGAALTPPPPPSGGQRVLCAAAALLQRLQAKLVRPVTATWMHALVNVDGRESPSRPKTH